MKLPAFLFCAALAVACRTAEPTRPVVSSDEYLQVNFVPDGEGPAGWIYAFDRGEFVDLCVYIWSSGRWSIATETSPGYYGTKIAEGPIENGCARGFPEGLIETSRNLYVAGHVEAWLAGQPLRRHPEAPVISSRR